MRRFLLAALAFTLLFLPFRLGNGRIAPVPMSGMAGMDCCPCSGQPTCPPACPSPAPGPACAPLRAPMAMSGEIEIAAFRSKEASPLPGFFAPTGSRTRARFQAKACFHDEPPDRSADQARLRVFRI